MKSEVFKLGKREFRYDYDNALVELVSKATEEEKKDNIEWQRKYGRNLWEIDGNGYIINERVGLHRENWDNIECRKEYLAEWSSELDEEAEYMIADFLKYEMKGATV